MLLSFTPEQRALRDVVRRFGLEEIAPVRRQLERDRPLFRSLSRRIAELGLLEIVSGDEIGASDAYVTLGVVAEELGRYDTSLAQVVSGAASRASRIARLADPSLAASLYERWLGGNLLLVAGFTEAGAGSDMRGLRTSARRVDGGVVINGEKNAVTGLQDADYVSVLARELDRDGTELGFSQYLVPTDAQGMSIASSEDMGWKVRGHGSLGLTDVFVAEGLRVGAPGSGVHQALGGFNYIRAAQGLVCLGAAAATLEETVEHVTSRHAFGRPLAANQAVSFALAEARTYIDAARWMCYRVLALRDKGLEHATEAAMAKWFAPEVAIDVIRRCLRLNGHAGYSSELPIEQRLRDVIGFEMADGSSETMKLIVSRAMFGKAVVG